MGFCTRREALRKLIANAAFSFQPPPGHLRAATAERRRADKEGQLVALQRERTLLYAAVPIGKSAVFNIEDNVVIADVVGTEMRDAAFYDRPVFLRRSVGAPVTSEFRQAIPHNHQGVAPIAFEIQHAVRIWPELVDFFAPRLMTFDTSCQVPTSSLALWASAKSKRSDRKITIIAASANRCVRIMVVSIIC
jgi:hypothetical protein